MQAAVKADWLKRLRETPFTVAPSADLIAVGGGLNALGILCDTIDPNGWQGFRWHGSSQVPGDLPLTPSAIAKIMAMAEGGATYGMIADWADVNVPVEPSAIEPGCWPLDRYAAYTSRPHQWVVYAQGHTQTVRRGTMISGPDRSYLGIRDETTGDEYWFSYWEWVRICPAAQASES